MLGFRNSLMPKASGSKSKSNSEKEYQGKGIVYLIWIAVIGSEIIFPAIFTVPFIYLAFRNNYERDGALFRNLKWALNLAIANLLILIVVTILYLTYVLLPIGYLIKTCLTAINIFFAIYGIISVFISPPATMDTKNQPD
jgi:hypothetical protein